MNQSTFIKNLGKHRLLFLKLFLLLFSLIPYKYILPEVINPAAFLVLTVIFLLQPEKGLQKKDRFWVLLYLLSFTIFFVAKDRVIVGMDSLSTIIIITAFLLGKRIEKTVLGDMLTFVLYGGMLNAVFSILIYVNTHNTRLEGIINYANSSALLFGICIVIYIIRSINEKTEPVGKQTEFAIDRKTLELFGTIVIGCALYLTQSRAGIIVYVLALGWIVFQQRANCRHLLFDILLLNLGSLAMAYTVLHRYTVACFITIMVLFVVLYYKDKLFGRLSATKLKYFIGALALIVFFGIVIGSFQRITKIDIHSGQLQERLVFYQDGLRILEKNPFGIGAGMLSTLQFKYQTALYDIKYIHNGLLQIGLDFGLIFLLGFVVLVSSVWMKGVRSKQLNLTFFIVATMILFHSLIDFTMSFVYLNAILGLALGGLCPEQAHRDYTRKGANAVFLGMLAVSISFILVFLPGEALYNASFLYLQHNHVTKALKTLEVWDSFPIKSERYYNKKALYYYLLFRQKQDKKDIKQSLSNLEQASHFHSGYGVNYVQAAEEYTALGDYIGAAKSLEKQVVLKKFNTSGYDGLMIAYQKLYYKGFITKGNYFNSMKTVEHKIRNLHGELNPKAKYMKNQPSGRLSNRELILIANAYLAVNDLTGSYRYLDKVDKKSKAYREFIGK